METHYISSVYVDEDSPTEDDLSPPVDWEQGDMTIEEYTSFIQGTFLSYHKEDQDFWMQYCGFWPWSLEQWLVSGMRQDITSELMDVLEHREDEIMGSPDMFDMPWDELVDAAQDAEDMITLRRNSDVASFKPVFDLGYKNKGFTVNNQGFVIVHTDGACRGNGTANAKGGIGVWFGHNHVNNISETLTSNGKMTNSVAEIKAIIRALEVASKEGIKHLEVRSDSEYLIKSMKTWIMKWVQRGWVKEDGNPVMHKKLLRRLLSLMKDKQIYWVHVKREKNAEADFLAQQAAN